MNTQQQQAFDAMRSALEKVEIEITIGIGETDDEQIFCGVSKSLLKTVQPALTAAKEVQPFNPDWSLLEATQESLREHMAIAKEVTAQKVEATKYLVDGVRFKMAFLDQHDDDGDFVGTKVTCFQGYEKQLDGRWVALVAAEDDCHLTQQPAPAQRLSGDEIERKDHGNI